MLKKLYSFFVLLLLSLVLTACGKEKHVVITEPPELELLMVELTVPNEVEVGETVSMSSRVTMGERTIDKADEVVYEIWEEGKKSESIMIDSVNEGEGIYTAETSFDYDGTFHIQVHVTAEGQHTMPVEVVTVGDGGEYEEGGASDYHTEGFSMHFMKPTTVHQGDTKSLIVHIELHEEALEQLKVRYEIWHDLNDEKHDWVEAEETNPGEYTASYLFDEKATYTIVIHVEDDEELHEHEEHVISVD